MANVQFQPGCDFCDIARGDRAQTEVLWRTDSWMAFFPLDPATPGHTLVIPRTHVSDLWHSEVSLGEELMGAVIRMGQAIQTALSPDGLNLISSSGRTAEQTVFHLHLHLVPRWRGDGFGRIWPLESRYENSDLDIRADLIRNAYESLA